MIKKNNDKIIYVNKENCYDPWYVYNIPVCWPLKGADLFHIPLVGPELVCIQQFRQKYFGL